MTKSTRMRKIILDILIIACIIALIILAYQFYAARNVYKEAAEEYDQIRQRVNLAAETDHFDDLIRVNEDFVAWLEMRETAISYPVVQANDNDVYLSKTFEGKISKAGCIFMDYRNQTDFGDRHTILYGHNLRDGSMFSGLSHYVDDDYLSNHATIYTYTPSGRDEWHILVAKHTDIDDAGYRLDFADEADFLAFAAATLGNGVPINVDTRILTLSTCTNTSDDERFLLHAIHVATKPYA